MVKNRGIEISIVSQFDIRRLPEFPLPPATVEAESHRTKDNLAACLVPVYPGSQIWFEYNIEPPHPPGAIYFFKLLINQQPVTSWDSTAKYGYHGKTMYRLQSIPASGQDRTQLHQKGFQFCIRDGSAPAIEDSDDCIEIRVHRVEHRSRIRDAGADTDDPICQNPTGPLQFVDRGLLGPGRSQRRYRYQLLDPSDKPYAVFQFYYRTYDFLEQNNVLQIRRISMSSAVTSSIISSRTNSSLSSSGFTRSEHAAVPSHMKTETDAIPSTPPKQALSQLKSKNQLSPMRCHRTSLDLYLPLSDSEGSLNNIVKDSVEDLPSTVPRSPQSPHSKTSGLRRGSRKIELCVSGATSPRQKLKNKLSLAIRTDRNADESARRPLSPFTSGGMLRYLVSSGRSSAEPRTNDDNNPSSQNRVQDSNIRTKTGPRDPDHASTSRFKKSSTRRRLLNALIKRKD